MDDILAEKKEIPTNVLDEVKNDKQDSDLFFDFDISSSPSREMDGSENQFETEVIMISKEEYN